MMGIFDIFKKQPVEQPVTTTPIIIRNVIPKKTTPKDPTDKVRGWEAGQTGNLNFDWLSPTTSVNGLLKSSLTLTRARCRERVRNDDYAKGYIRMAVSNVVGNTGIRIQSIASDPNGQRDELAIQSIETAWNTWAKYPDNVDISGRDNWKAILEQLVSIYATDGELFIRHIEGKNANKFGYSIQIIDPALCDENLSLKMENGNVVEMGVELDKYNKAVAYWFLQPQSKDASPQSSSAKHLRIPAKEIIHAFKTEFAGQIRGIPPLAVALPRLKMLSDWEDASLVNAQIGASKMGFYTTAGAEDVTTGVNAIDPDGELIDEVRPGQFSKLPAGVGFEKFESEYPNGELAPFKKSMLRGISTGIGVDYPTLGNDLEAVNLSSARVAINETRELYKAQQQFIIDKVVTPVFERWLAQALVRKQITVKGKPLSILNIEKYKQVSWLPRRWQYADPARDTKSNVDLVNNRIKSLSTVANELGYDFETEVQLMAKDEEFLAKFGLVRVDQMPDEVDMENEDTGNNISDSKQE